MAKFAPTEQSVEEIILNLKSTSKRNDARLLVEIFKEISNENPIVWHPGIIGFGQYEYKYETGTKGQTPFLAFAPRQAKISLYIDQDLPNRDEILSRLGKHKLAVGCVYVNKLADIDLDVLKELLNKSYTRAKEKSKKYKN